MLERITLKSVKFHQGLEGSGLNADIYIDNKKVAHVMDDGNGGCFNYDVLGSGTTNEDGKYIDSPERTRNKILFKEFNDYVDTLPEEEMGSGDNAFMFKPDMDGVVDDLVNEIERKKGEKKMKKHMIKNIVFGKRGGNSYSAIGYKMPIAEVIIRQGNNKKVQELVDKIKANKLSEGEEILNDNLEALGITV